MLKSVAMGSWACVVTIGAIYLGDALTPGDADIGPDTGKKIDVVHYTEPTTLVAPIVVDEEISGYLFSRVLVGYDPEIKKSIPASLDLIMHDAYHSLVVGSADYSFPNAQRLEFIKFKHGIVTAINRIAGSELAKSADMGDLNFLTVQEVRKKQELRTVWIQKQPDHEEPEPQPEPKK